MKYTFFEALAIVVGTKRKIRYKRGDWAVYYGDDCPVLLVGTYRYWPSVEKQKVKVWEVEEEPIYVWGACDEDGQSCLYDVEPRKNSDGNWMSRDSLTLNNDDLFSKDKLQKYKLVPVED